MTNVRFFASCFLVGISASCAVGPIFVLTFNRSAVYGFSKGFATAIGAALADAIFFALGLLGALSFFEDSRYFIIAMDFIGAAILLYLGIRSIQNHKKVESAIPANIGLFTAGLKSFTLTIVNPVIGAFFMFMSLQIAPQDNYLLPYSTVILASGVLALGTVSMLSVISLIGSTIGNAISKKSLSRLTCATGISFILISFYLIFDLMKRIF